MPTYDIHNRKTGETKEVFCNYADKEKTLKEEGPDWEYEMCAPGLTLSQGAVTLQKRAGKEWNDVLKGIKKASDPKKCTIETD